MKLKELERLQQELVHSFERATHKDKMKGFFAEFFTRTEKVMLAKRLAIIAMLSRGVAWNAVANILNVSPSTVERMALAYSRGRYSNIEKFALGKKDNQAILEAIITLDGNLPPKSGRGRHNALNKIFHKLDVLDG